MIFLLSGFSTLSAFLNKKNLKFEFYSNYNLVFGGFPGYEELNQFWWITTLFSVLSGIVLVNIIIARLSNKYTELEEK